MTPEDLFWFIESILVLFLISVSTWLKTEDKKIDRKWEFQIHNGHATLLILRKANDLIKEREFWGEIWMLEYDYYNNLTSPSHEKYIFGKKLLSFANTLHTMFYSICYESFEKEVIL